MRKFVIIWIGQLISTIGSGLTGFALSIWIYPFKWVIPRIHIAVELLWVNYHHSLKVKRIRTLKPPQRIGIVPCLSEVQPRFFIFFITSEPLPQAVRPVAHPRRSSTDSNRDVFAEGEEVPSIDHRSVLAGEHPRRPKVVRR